MVLNMSQPGEASGAEQLHYVPLRVKRHGWNGKISLQVWRKPKKIQPGTEERGIKTDRRENEAARRAVGQTGP